MIRSLCVITLAGVAGLIAASASHGQTDFPANPEERQALRRTPVVKVVQATRDAVVNISSTQIIEYRSPMGFDDLFQQFFDSPGNPLRQRVQQYKATSVGSGFVIHRDGYIVTNAHVVARTAERKVIFDDQRQFAAEVIAIDHQRDLAVLKIDPPAPLHTIRLGHSHDLMIGETVIAIGNPLGYQHTVTAGVVSAIERSVELKPGVTFDHLIQTDASINPGNSGGPLLNVLGELVGINTAIRADAQNIGFAISVDQLRALLPAMLDPERRYGIALGMRVSSDDRCRVMAVDIGSPAHQAGMQVGDILLDLDQHALTSGIDYYIHLIGRKPGEQLAFTLDRNGVKKHIAITLGERPRRDAQKILSDLLGLTLTTITPRIAEQSGLPGLQGLVVTQVADGSPADQSGLQRGDVIDHIGQYHVRNLDDAGELLQNIASGQQVPLTVMRFRGRTVYRTTVTLTAR
ncbi:MAG: trypsin-like peptidase domain-containing protein [Phycisphaeraceae bacterium]|nr:trypsin-like peptidase domain-containing protein [Phycisphaeraceae bacterium]